PAPFLGRGDVPDNDGAVRSHRNQGFVILGMADLRNATLVAIELHYLLPCANVPTMNGAIIACRKDTFPVVRKEDDLNFAICVAEVAESTYLIAISHIPQNDVVVGASRSQVSPVTRKGDA